MVGIYKYENGLKFTGIVAETEEKAWTYLDKKVGKENKFRIGEEWFYPKANRDAFEVKSLTLVKD